MSRPALDDVRRARHRMAGDVWQTPVVRADWLSERAGCGAWLKLESLQPSRSFKIRGALNAVSEIEERARVGAAPSVPRVVTASAGNHGLALSIAAERRGIGCVVFTPAGAPAAKLGAIRRRGADLRATAVDYDDAERLALAYAAAEGLPYISPYNHPAIISGAGTVALEILEQHPAAEVLVVPVGGGGLLSGVLIAARAVAPTLRVIGVEAALNPAFRTSIAQGRIARILVQPTIADGLGGNLEPGSMTFDIVCDLVDDMVTVDEAAIGEAMRDLLAEEHLVVEGAGAVAVAALAAGVVAVRGRTAVALVTGANVDLPRLLDIAGRQA